LARDTVCNKVHAFITFFSIAYKTRTILAFGAFSGRGTFSTVFERSRAEYARMMVNRYMVTFVAGVAVIDRTATKAIRNNILAKFAMFVSVYDKLILTSFACCSIFANATVRNEKIAILAFSCINEIIIFAG
jgi:hypothetical protein